MEIDHEETSFKYAVKYAIPAHNGDVRAVVATRHPENGFVTSSRDTLVKLWASNIDGCYNEAAVFCGATKFVSSLCALPASDEYPEGLILAGSNDCSIYGFAVNKAEPIMKLLAHSGNVCSLSAGPFGTFVSGSWDKTARVWSGQDCYLVLSGHQEAVWAAEFLHEPNLVLTASADHTIRLWCSGKCEKVYAGHNDCVRGLAILHGGNFLSCSNDCTVRLWSIAGDCLATYKSHISYIYGITLLPTGSDFATCGEDGKVKIWKNGDCVQSLHFPGKTLWSMACASNGTLAVGCSDGTLYILGEIPTGGDAPEETLEDQHMHEIIGEQQNVDSTILDKGDFDGETRLVFEQEKDCMVVYSWDATSSQWKKKDAVSEGVIGNIAKSHHVDREEVNTLKFNVDVEGVMYPIVYKAGEKPWDVAQKFVVEHNLAVDHIAQIATFILDRTGDGSWNAYDAVRKEKFISYSNANVSGIAAKLVEFNSKVSQEHQLSEHKLKDLMIFVTFPKSVTMEQMAALETALMWEDEYLYPVLDLLRLAVKSVAMHSKISNPSFISHLLQVLTQTGFWMNCNLTIKIFCNMFGYNEGKETLQKFHERIISAVGDVLQKGDKRIEKAGSALFLNYSLLISDFRMPLDTKLYCLKMVEFITIISDFEAVYRVLLAVSSILEFDINAVKELVVPKFVGTLLKFQTMKIPKTKETLQRIFLKIGNFDDCSDKKKPLT